jgi:glycosyltransferase involved in cell wall biosynthesis
MKIYIVIPAHNEENFIAQTLDSLINQTLLPKRIVVVDDNSSDNTTEVISKYTAKYDWIEGKFNSSSKKHMPGNKVINAFYKGFELLDDEYDIICKFDADLIFPNDYLETIVAHYNSDDHLGMVAGHCYVADNNQWKLETSTGKDHIRGALKSYRKKCFEDIGMLKRSMGWDTVDEWLALYYNWTFKIDPELRVKHLKPTGAHYSPAAKTAQGEAFYKMRFGFFLTLLRALKISYRKKSARFFIQTIKGYNKAKKEQQEYLISENEGYYIRTIQKKGIFKNIFGN